MKTTHEKAKEHNHEKLVDNLQELLEKNYDAEKGFTKAMKDAENSRLKTFLQQQAAQRGRFTNELSQEIINLNEKPKDSGSFTGDLHRTWIDIKSAVSGNDDEAVLEECIRGEKASWEEYEDKLKNYNFPPKISNLLQKQASEIHTTLNRVKTLEDLADD
ncbi:MULTISPECIES: ferritin-like domain-containing protein [Aequorivita]|uniref:PA2169 family four-helix-bundle protein n=1 Tax=Aequorivita iocasae TaxID=2803865 RepID=A0ABX7DPK8_9FLAO|nr:MULTISPECIES: PA2169 family four-helix-bundle protein [Aequorivita]QQX75732.1 PA2169 family four-helix-bundle protein [Aequorivita iocasae]UCA55191.1 PA2169 family four-helix-bundle protein [Aequorivita sp. F7]